jgi:hypothetical protein
MHIETLDLSHTNSTFGKYTQGGGEQMNRIVQGSTQPAAKTMLTFVSPAVQPQVKSFTACAAAVLTVFKRCFWQARSACARS